jgi:tetratricopeptide (TPR) repeat protein
VAAHLGLKSPDFLIEQVLPGGMGVCCKIIHIESDTAYALKMLGVDAGVSQAGHRRFIEEMRLWSTASTCDGVVEAYIIDRTNEAPCICARWMAGGDLRARISDHRPSFFFNTMDRLIGTLEWVYGEYKIIHRDLKPSNVLLDEQAKAFISDWGIARVRGEGASSSGQQPQGSAKVSTSLTQTGQFIGTIPYSSPEQILGIREIDHRADIYSLGCMMFEWETGSTPFLGSSREEIGYKHLELAPPKLGGFLKKTAFGADKIIERCLQKKPADRFQNYADLRQALTNVALSRGVNLKGNYLAKRRYALPLVGAGEIDKERWRNAVAEEANYAVVKMDDLAPYLKEAEVLCGVREWGKAAAILERVFVRGTFEKSPDSPLHQFISTNLGRCLVNLGKIDEALEVLRSISCAKKKVSEYFLNLSGALLGRNNIEAERIAREGLKEHPNDLGILGNLTLALFQQSKLADAKEVAETRLKRFRDIHSLDEMGIVLLAIGGVVCNTDYPSAAKNYAGALLCLREAKTLNPRYLGARINLAAAWFELEEYGRSVEELSEISELNVPLAYAELWALQKAQCMDRAASFEECQKFFDEWLKNLPKSIMLERIRAEYMTDYFIGKEKDGIRIIEKGGAEFFTDIIARPDRRVATDFIYMGRIKEWMGEVDAAFSLFDKAEELAPRIWEVPYCRALAYWRLREFEAALSQAKKACTLGPWRPKTWGVLSTVYKTMGLNREAEEYQHKSDAVTARREELRQAAVRGHTQNG